MTGVIDVGGGLRGIYGAGVFDRCIDDGVKFDYCIGVSAGAANIAHTPRGREAETIASSMSTPSTRNTWGLTA